MLENSLQKGLNVIKDISKKVPIKSGIYKMISDKKEVLYVGKAKLLKNRIMSYTSPNRLNYRLQKMISLVRKVEYITTNNEAQALLLEASLIKELKPKFNILLKDDKTYPYISIRKGHAWPQIKKHRGKKNNKDIYFGPFASVSHVNITIDTLQKIFPLRSCTDFEVANRNRPCLQHQIRRCVAPCTNNIEKKKYNSLVDDLESYLLGKSKSVISSLINKMNDFSTNLEYEKAAMLRDKIRALENINKNERKEWKEIVSADLFCVTRIKNILAIEVVFCRNSQSFGSSTHYPNNHFENDLGDVLSKFIAQFYNNNIPPNKIITSHYAKEFLLLSEALSAKYNKNIQILAAKNFAQKKVIREGTLSAEQNLAIKIAKKEKILNHHKVLKNKFNLTNDVRRIEVYDNSHFSGKEAVGSYIVAGDRGFQKSEYRKFNIRDASKSDDYGMMREVLERRLKQDNNLPDLIIIDGGKGHLMVSREIIDKLRIKSHVDIISISKGKFRNANNDKFYDRDGEEIFLSRTDPIFYYLQKLRDEAHRYAINNHRVLRKKSGFSSEIDNIPDVGPKRKKQLLLFFGSKDDLKKANLTELKKAPGISNKVAEKIYYYFNSR